MSTFFLKRRDTELSEFMDDPDCDLALLQNTYRQFRTVNGLVSGWKRVYKRFIRPHLFNGATILDIGCGGGDLLIRLSMWAANDGFAVQITGIDPDPRALAYTRSISIPKNVSVHGMHTSDLIKEKRLFDVVVSNHVLHHLSQDELGLFLDDSIQLTRHSAVHSDIRRHDLAYLGFLPSHFLFRNSFIAADGLRSIRRSFTRQELEMIIEPKWSARQMPLFRNVLVSKP